MDKLNENKTEVQRTVIKVCDAIPVSEGFPAYFEIDQVTYASISDHLAGDEKA